MIEKASFSSGLISRSGRSAPESQVVPTPSTCMPRVLRQRLLNVGNIPKMPMEPVMVLGLARDLVGRGRDPVASRRRHAAHRDHDGLARRARARQLLADHLRGEGLPPPLSTRSTTAFTLSSRRALRTSAAVEPPPIVPGGWVPSRMVPFATTTATASPRLPAPLRSRGPVFR